MSDPAKYSHEGELDSRKKESDPLKITEGRLSVSFGLESARMNELKESVEAEDQEAWEFAESSPKPDPANLYDYVYTD